jgi:hypothetical protein
MCTSFNNYRRTRILGSQRGNQVMKLISQEIVRLSRKVQPSHNISIERLVRGNSMRIVVTGTRAVFTVAMLFLGLAVGVSAQPNRGGGWVRLGDAHVDGGTDHDKIKVHGEGPFTSLRLDVSGSAVEFDHMLVHFENGETQNLRASFVVRNGSNSPNIYLKGNARNIDSVELWYKRGSWSNKPEVTLFGRK